MKRTNILTLAIILLTLATATQAAVDFSNAFHYWSLNENSTRTSAIDSINSSWNLLEYKNDPLVSQGDFVSGKFGNSWEGITGQLNQLVSENQTQTNLPPNWSISYWFNTTNINNRHFVIVNDIGDGITTNNYLYARVENNANAGIEIEYNRGYGGMSNVSGSGYNDGNWHNVIITFDTTHEQIINVYMDGIISASEINITGFQGAINITNVAIACVTSICGAYNSGRVDEVVIWNKVLNTTDITELYNGGAGLTFPSDNSTIIPEQYQQPDIVEGTFQEYFLNITVPPDIVYNVTATFIWNATSYPVTDTENLSQLWTFNASLIVPFFPQFTGNTTIDGYWQYDIYSYIENITDFTNYTQSFGLGIPNLTICNPTNTILLINYSFYDEGNQSLIPADSIYNLNWELSGRTTSTQTMIDTATDAESVSICTSLQGIYTIDQSISYQADDHPQRFYNSENTNFDTNNPSNISLYLLATNDGIYGRIRAITQFQNPIPGVLITAQRSISGTNTTTESEITDDAGLATFFVDPDEFYTFTLTKTGYTSVVTTLRLTSADITNIVLVQEGVSGNNSYYFGVTPNFDPPNSPLQNNTDYLFTFNLTSTFWNITNCYARLDYDNNTVITLNQGSFSSDGCNATILFNTDNLTGLNLYGIYETDNTNTTLLKTYTILYTYIGQFSIANFFTDLKNFSGSGFNDFTRMIIAFITICAITFALSRTPLVPNIESTILLIIILVWFFSFVGFLTSPLATDTLIGDVSQYIVAVMMTMTGLGFIIWRNT